LSIFWNFGIGKGWTAGTIFFNGKLCNEIAWGDGGLSGIDLSKLIWIVQRLVIVVFVKIGRKIEQYLQR